MMSLEQRLEKALDERDLVSVKAHLTSFIDKYPRNENNVVISAFDHARTRFPELVEAHDGGKLRQSKSMWDADYLAMLMDDLIDNFSMQRFFHTVEVASFIHCRKFELEQEEEDELSNRRKHDFSTWIMLISATILFLALVFLIRSVL